MITGPKTRVGRQPTDKIFIIGYAPTMKENWVSTDKENVLLAYQCTERLELLSYVKAELDEQFGTVSGAMSLDYCYATFVFQSPTMGAVRNPNRFLNSIKRCLMKALERAETKYLSDLEEAEELAVMP